MDEEDEGDECPTQKEIDEGLERREEEQQTKDFAAKRFCQQYFGRMV
jgi:hypothetical protein